MKLNDKQKYALLLFLGRFGKSPIHEVVFNIDKFCNEEITEWRIISVFGFAGKIWNHPESIYVSGHYRSELTEYSFDEQQKEIKAMNEHLTELLELFK